jgi:hypothetical protein
VFIFWIGVAFWGRHFVVPQIGQGRHRERR